MFCLGHQKSPMAPFFCLSHFTKHSAAPTRTGNIALWWAHMSSCLTEKGKIVPKPLESDPKVTHIISFQHLHSSLCIFFTLYELSDFSIPEVLAATGHSKTVLPVCSPHLLTVPSTWYVGCTEQCKWGVNSLTMLGRTSWPPTSAKFLVKHLNHHLGIQKTPLLRLLNDFLSNTQLYILCAEDWVWAGIKNCHIQKTYWALKISAYCAWKHPQRRAFDLNYVHLFSLMTFLLLCF